MNELEFPLSQILESFCTELQNNTKRNESMLSKVEILCQKQPKLSYLEGCSVCSSNISTFDLHFQGLHSCQRKFCKLHLQFYIQMIVAEQESLHGDPYLYPCDECEIPVNLAYISTIFDLKNAEELESIFGLKSNFRDEQEEEMKTKTCNICIEQYSLKYIKNLPCTHYFCQNCLAEHFGVKIREGKTSVDDLSCPECQVPCGFQILYEVLSQDDYKKLINFSLKAKETEGLASSGRDMIVTCPFCSVKEDKIFFITKSDIEHSTIQKCRECHHKFCVLCKEKHRKRISCEEHQRRKKDKVNDEMMEELKKKEGLVECPKCGIVAQRAEGCFYMTCQSLKCRGKTTFCGICGKYLRSEYLHFAHYPQGPFIKKCNTTEGLEDPEERNYIYK